MNPQELTALLDRLRAEPHESEWLEFKANRFEPQTLGEYLSALANSACLLGKPRAYLVCPQCVAILTSLHSQLEVENWPTPEIQG
jgi:hypothetical protein